MTTDTDRSTEGDLIERAREEKGMSQNAAARAAGMSGTRWRQIVNGVGTASSVRVPVEGPPATLARMALAVGLQAKQLSDAGRTDVAEAMAGADPLTAPAPAWEGTLQGPKGQLEEGETLMWRQDRKGTLYRFERPKDGISTETVFPPDEPQERVIEDLRHLMELHLVAVRQIERRREHQ